ncbi:MULTISPECIES: hypothetical protein [Caballeronia]|uniref:hypothetical protein n=1 Tax=Caballeronia TaxID=1827195 RepID=UPI0011848741|nr:MULTISPECIES: hypothetical protein [Caballeronia]MCE4546330.1 hypothetical protein [Caballeronia sp. PC1]MCE4573195.1 hypothetical protein [Caballeronia sp. CLC5]
MTAKEQFSSTRLSRAAALLEESRMLISLPSSQIVAAFNAIYLCCLHCEELSPRSVLNRGNGDSDIVLAVANLIADSRLPPRRFDDHLAA